MAVNSNLLKALENHKFKNNDTITYTSLNDSDDKRTVTDIANEIYKAIKGSNKKDKLTVLNAIFDGVYDVVENTSSNKNSFGLVDSKKGEFAELEIKLVKDIIEFNTKNAKIKLNFKIATPEVVEKTANWNGSKSKKELIEKLEKTTDKKSLESFAKLVDAMLKTQF